MNHAHCLKQHERSELRNEHDVHREPQGLLGREPEVEDAANNKKLKRSLIYKHFEYSN
jgi:hypothetical protein